MTLRAERIASWADESQTGVLGIGSTLYKLIQGGVLRVFNYLFTYGLMAYVCNSV